ncbi:hypothetical protein [Neobacillus drentensis]|uniref:hypothetical protein n=1 Tax=Neobacillus drentensis TaxID=220684 RepID=UPI003000E556
MGICISIYAFVSFSGSEAYYVEKDSSGEIIDNEIFDSFGNVHVNESGNLETQGVLVNTAAFSKLKVSGAKQIYEILNDQKNYQSSGYYKIGADLLAGTYVLQSEGEGYVATLTGGVGKNDIIDNEIFNGRYKVTVSNSQYLKISKAVISK